MADGLVLRQSAVDFVVGRRSQAWFGGPGDSTRVSYAELTRVEVRRPPRSRSKVMAVGIVTGLVGGAALGARSVHQSCEGPGSGFGPCISRGEGAMMGGLLGLMAGSGVALIITRSRWQTLLVTEASSS